jgi:transportin-3
MALRLRNKAASSGLQAAILREFSEDREHVDEQTTEAIYAFFEAQSTNMLRMMSDLPPNDLPDVIEDFYRLLVDALLYYPHKLVHQNCSTPIFQAAISRWLSSNVIR